MPLEELVYRNGVRLWVLALSLVMWASAGAILVESSEREERALRRKVQSRVIEIRPWVQAVELMELRNWPESRGANLTWQWESLERSFGEGEDLDYSLRVRGTSSESSGVETLMSSSGTLNLEGLSEERLSWRNMGLLSEIPVSEVVELEFLVKQTPGAIGAGRFVWSTERYPDESIGRGVTNSLITSSCGLVCCAIVVLMGLCLVDRRSPRVRGPSAANDMRSRFPMID